MSVKKTAGEVLGSSESQASSEFSWRTLFNGAVVVSALGYFVDIYDLLLFNIVRIPSLRELGLTGQELSAGAFLHNTQMVGMMVGGVLWGVLGDKRGRLSVLFGSIFLYSIANLLNAWVASYEQYAVLRFLAGVGLAGELGAGITLVAESLPSALRGYGTMLVATVGVSGAIVAGWLGQVLHWRTCYGIGGGLGLLLLALRIGVLESGLYEGVLKKANVVRGNFFELFKTRERFVRYLCCILIGIPVWYVIGILVAYSPEFAKALGTSEPVIAAKSVMWCYAGLVAGDLLSGLISQWLKSRLKVVLLFLGLTATLCGDLPLAVFTNGLHPLRTLFSLRVRDWLLGGLGDDRGRTVWDQSSCDRGDHGPKFCTWFGRARKFALFSAEGTLRDHRLGSPGRGDRALLGLDCAKVSQRNVWQVPSIYRGRRGVALRKARPFAGGWLPHLNRCQSLIHNDYRVSDLLERLCRAGVSRSPGGGWSRFCTMFHWHLLRP
jgi:putative MFS transporter